MGLFTAKPYDMSSLNIAEKAAVRTALQIATTVDHNGSMKKDLSSALKDFEKGKLSKNDMSTVIACLIASLAALKSGDDPERTTLLRQKQVVELSMAMALDKLKDML